MTQKMWMVRPNEPTRAGEYRTVLYPPTDTLVLSFTMQGLWELPADIDIERYKAAVAQTLSIFPLAAGRLRKYPDTKWGKGDIFIQLNNHGTPVAYEDDYELENIPISENVIIHPQEMERWILPMPLDIVNTDEPLVRFKFTKLHKTGKTIYTFCWLHALGDGYISNLFMTYIAYLYRGESIAKLPVPSLTKVYFQPPPSDPALAEKFLPLMKHLRDAKPMEELIPALMQSEEQTLPVHISFTSQQMKTLMTRAASALTDPSTRLSKVGAVVAYLVLHYNQVLAEVHPEQEQIDTIVNTLDYRGNPRFAPPAMIGNCAITLTSPPFKGPSPLPRNASPRERERHFNESLAAVCLSINAGTALARDPDFLEPYLQYHNELCRRAYQEGKYQYILPAAPNEITFNSSHAASWLGPGDLFPEGSKWAKAKYTRFHTSVIIEKYIRIFGGNPAWISEKDGREGHWDFSMVDGIECAFRLDETIAKVFEERVKHDLQAGIGGTFARL